MFAPSIFVPTLDLIQRTLYNIPDNKKKVYVVGYGWGGKAFCDTIDTRFYDVTIINKTPNFICTPKLIRVNECQKAIQPIQEKKLIIDEVLNIDNVSKSIITKNNSIKQFDYLVVASGSVPNTFNIEGVETCGFYKTPEDVEKVKQSLSNNNNYEIIGAGPSGIEVAFELSNSNKQVTLIEAADKVLPNFSDDMRNKVLEKMKTSSIKLLTNHKVHKIDDKHIHTDKTLIPRNYTLWMSGIKPLPLVKDIANVNNYLEYSKYIYVIGDSIKGHGPPTAQNAQQQGYYVAHRFNNKFVSEPYKFIERGKIIHTSDSILIEHNNSCYEIPKLFRPIIDYFVY